MSECAVGGCSKKVTARGMCHTHYGYALKQGLVGTWKFPAPPLQRQMRMARLDGESWADFSVRIGVRRASIESVLRNSKVEWTTADEITCALGLHPILIYPNWTEVFDMDAYLERRREAGLQAEALAS